VGGEGEHLRRRGGRGNRSRQMIAQPVEHGKPGRRGFVADQNVLEGNA